MRPPHGVGACLSLKIKNQYYSSGTIADRRLEEAPLPKHGEINYLR